MYNKIWCMARQTNRYRVWGVRISTRTGIETGVNENWREKVNETGGLESESCINYNSHSMNAVSLIVRFKLIKPFQIFSHVDSVFLHNLCE